MRALILHVRTIFKISDRTVSCIVEFTGNLPDPDTTSTGMGAGGNGNNQWEMGRE